MMNKKWLVAIDNGVSGTISFILLDGSEYFFEKTPVKKVQDFTKKKKNVNRVDVKEFKGILNHYISLGQIIRVYIERPLVNPRMFNATMSAVRCLEAELVIIEDLELSYEFMDSKEWQKSMLPKGIQGKNELKFSSLDIGNRLFPKYKDFKHPDRDSLLMVEHVRRSYNKV